MNLIDERMQLWLGFGSLTPWEESSYRIADMESAWESFPF